MSTNSAAEKMPEVLPVGPAAGPVPEPAPVVEAASAFIQVGSDWVSINSAAEKTPEALPVGPDADCVGPVKGFCPVPTVGGLPGSILRNHSGRLASLIND